MPEIMVSTDLLKRSVSNVRVGHTKEDIAVMANSIKHRGIINPPTVAKNGDGKYEIIAGNLRVAGAIAAGVEEIRCFDVSALTPVERVELSLSENIDRAQMTAIEKYKAFAQLFKAGMSVPSIADKFSTTEVRVQQVLAIGTLPKKILQAAENDEIGDRALQALAIAPGAAVTRYAKLKPDERPSDWRIEEWLSEEKGWYDSKVALFDLDEYKGPKGWDMFAEDETHILFDGEQFWELQEKAIIAQIDKLQELGWTVNKLEFFNEWQFDKAAKKDGGEVWYTVHPKTGEVKFHKGYKKRPRTGNAPLAKDGKEEKKEQPEISNAFSKYMDEMRHAYVAHNLATNTTTALVGTLVLLLKQADNVNFQYKGGNMGEAYVESLNCNAHQDGVYEAWKALLKSLNLEDHSLYALDAEKLTKQLQGYTPGQLAKAIGTVMARFWSINDAKVSDAMARGFGMKQVDCWEADDTFWNGIKNKQTLIKIAKEFGVKIDFDSATAKAIRKICKEKAPADWRPDWLIF